MHHDAGFDTRAIYTEVVFAINGSAVHGERGLRRRQGDEPYRDDVGKAEPRRALDVVCLPAVLVFRQKLETGLGGNDLAPARA